MTYDAGTDAPSQQRDERLVRDFLTGQGWVPGGSATLVSGAGAVLRFEVPGCIGTVSVGLLPPSGEMASLFARATGADNRVFYAYRGRTSGDPPRLAHLHAKAARMTEILGLPRLFDRPVVAISQPRTCRLETTLAWSEL